jgi:two-component system, NtrC family, sensor kinase
MALRTRLIVGVSIVVALVLGLESVVEIRLFEETAERELRETGLVTAQSVADDLELRPTPLRAEDLVADLHEFAQSAPSIRSISVIQLVDGSPAVVASTASTESPAALTLARDLLTHGEQGPRDDGTMSRVAMRSAPAGGSPFAVVVTMSLAPIAQLRTRGRLVSLWLVPLAVIILIFVLDQIMRRIVYAPVRALRETMTRAGAGDLAARAAVFRSDEMGELARGFNDMLDRLSGFNQALEERVAAVTTALDRSHEERIDSYRQMLVLRDALADADRLATIGQTAASVAHQVGTPLNLISGHVQLLLEQRDLDPDLARRLHLVLEQIGRVSDAIRGLLEHTRRPGEAAPVDLGTLLDTIVNLVRPRLSSTHVALDSAIAPSLPAVRGHRDELEMALLNLVTNAVDAMPAGGVLRVAAATHEDQVTIALSDTGAGITPEMLPRIFDPWVTTKPEGRGTGLGLTITRDVITRLGGSLDVTSEPGRGTTFTITLPADAGGMSDDANAADR